VTVLLRRRPAMPDTPAAVAAHLEHLRLRGRAAATGYVRRKALARMQNVIPVPLLQATEADLLAWRAGLKLSDYATSAYASHAKEFYRWAAGQGLIASSPAARLPVPSATATVSMTGMRGGCRGCSGRGCRSRSPASWVPDGRR
jgi:hypothetical protein